MIYELRIYRCVPGRTPALLSRFENETRRIWEKHGIRRAAFWATLVGQLTQGELTTLPSYPRAMSELRQTEVRIAGTDARPLRRCARREGSRRQPPGPPHEKS
jgi:NIPSNAP